MKQPYKETRKIKESGRGRFAEFNLPWNIYWVERALAHHQQRTNRPMIPMVVLEMQINPLTLTFTISLKVALCSRTFNSQHDSDHCE